MTIILVHGYLGFPENCWFPWLRKELEARGHTVIAPAMPNPEFPVKDTWVQTIEKVVTDPSSTILVGHSLGCVAILRYLESTRGPSFPHVILTAGFGRDFMHAKELNGWFSTPIDFALVRSRANRWTSIHSWNDLLVPYPEGQWLSEQLGSTFVKENKGHLTKREGAAELPSVLEAVLATPSV